MYKIALKGFLEIYLVALRKGIRCDEMGVRKINFSYKMFFTFWICAVAT